LSLNLKLSTFVRLCVITGFRVKTSGFVYDASDNETLTEISNAPYVKLNFLAIAGLGIKYNLNNKFSLMLYPYYKYHLNSMIENDFYYKQFIDNAGISFGIRYKF
jgi:hypothetical protein